MEDDWSTDNITPEALEKRIIDSATDLEVEKECIDQETESSVGTVEDLLELAEKLVDCKSRYLIQQGVSIYDDLNSFDNPDTRYSYALGKYKLGRYREAIDILNSCKALSIIPAQEIALRQLCMRNLGSRSESKSKLESLKTTDSVSGDDNAPIHRRSKSVKENIYNLSLGGSKTTADKMNPDKQAEEFNSNHNADGSNSESISPSDSSNILRRSSRKLKFSSNDVDLSRILNFVPDLDDVTSIFDTGDLHDDNIMYTDDLHIGDNDADTVGPVQGVAAGTDWPLYSKSHRSMPCKSATFMAGSHGTVHSNVVRHNLSIDALGGMEFSNAIPLDTALSSSILKVPPPTPKIPPAPKVPPPPTPNMRSPLVKIMPSLPQEGQKTKPIPCTSPLNIVPTSAPKVPPPLPPSLPKGSPSIIPPLTPIESPSVPPPLAPSESPSVPLPLAPSELPSVPPPLVHKESPSVPPPLVHKESPSVPPPLVHKESPSVPPPLAPRGAPSVPPPLTPKESPSVPLPAPRGAPSVPPPLAPRRAPSVPPPLAPKEPSSIPPFSASKELQSLSTLIPKESLSPPPSVTQLTSKESLSLLPSIPKGLPSISSSLPPLVPKELPSLPPSMPREPPPPPPSIPKEPLQHMERTRPIPFIVPPTTVSTPSAPLPSTSAQKPPLPPSVQKVPPSLPSAPKLPLPPPPLKGSPLPSLPRPTSQPPFVQRTKTSSTFPQLKAPPPIPKIEPAAVDVHSVSSIAISPEKQPPIPKLPLATPTVIHEKLPPISDATPETSPNPSLLLKTVVPNTELPPVPKQPPPVKLSFPPEVLPISASAPYIHKLPSLQKVTPQPPLDTSIDSDSSADPPVKNIVQGYHFIPSEYKPMPTALKLPNIPTTVPSDDSTTCHELTGVVSTEKDFPHESQKSGLKSRLKHLSLISGLQRQKSSRNDALFIMELKTATQSHRPLSVNIRNRGPIRRCPTKRTTSP